MNLKLRILAIKNIALLLPDFVFFHKITAIISIGNKDKNKPGVLKKVNSSNGIVMFAPLEKVESKIL
tara:strand:- start:44 stop:244 length:201 start_codon:yes stop_codon:yes gene_type:complete